MPYTEILRWFSPYQFATEGAPISPDTPDCIGSKANMRHPANSLKVIMKPSSNLRRRFALRMEIFPERLNLLMGSELLFIFGADQTWKGCPLDLTGFGFIRSSS
jgi:hypothetical protein